MRDIKGYEGLYAVTSCGKVWSYRSQKFLKPDRGSKGYLRVILCKNGEQKRYLVHRLVLETYNPVEGMEDLQVNHRDECPGHDWLNNLEWMTPKENSNYGTRNARISKPVYCVELDKIFDGVRAAARELGLNSSSICKCCKGKLKTHGGYHWRYVE